MRLGWAKKLDYAAIGGAGINRRIWTLAEDTVAKPQLIAEHGLAMFLATSTGHILFDTGQGLAALRSAAVMEIDLRRYREAFVQSGQALEYTSGPWIAPPKIEHRAVQVESGRPIPTERLEAMPLADRTMEEQVALELWEAGGFS